jgi:hypothetical protein
LHQRDYDPIKFTNVSGTAATFAECINFIKKKNALGPLSEAKQLTQIQRRLSQVCADYRIKSHHIKRQPGLICKRLSRKALAAARRAVEQNLAAAAEPVSGEKIPKAKLLYELFELRPGCRPQSYVIESDRGFAKGQGAGEEGRGASHLRSVRKRSTKNPGCCEMTFLFLDGSDLGGNYLRPSDIVVSQRFEESGHFVNRRHGQRFPILAFSSFPLWIASALRARP